MAETARIERLSVKAYRRRGVPMVQSAVEDAFRTQLSAAGPAARRGLLVIRRIDFGPIASRMDQVRINRKLAGILRQAASVGQDTAAPIDLDQPAVFFADPLEPYLQIARSIGRCETVPQNWVMRAIVGEAIFETPARLLNSMLIQQLRLAQAGPAIGAILRALGVRLPELASTIPSVTRSQILRELTIDQSSEPSAKVTLSDLLQLTRDLRVLTQQRWLVQGMVERPESPVDQASIVKLIVATSLTKDAGPIGNRRLSMVVAALRTPARPTGQHISLSKKISSTLQLLERLADPALADEVSEALDRANAKANASILKQFNKALLQIEIAESVLSSQAGLSQPIQRAAASSNSDEVKRQRELAVDERSGFEPSRYAGIAYLIALLDRAFGTWLANPDHFSRSTGQRLLHQILGRFDLHPEDPASRFLVSLGDLPEIDETPCAIVLSPEMLPRIRSAIMVSPVAGHHGWRMATLGPVLIATWRGRAPMAVRKLLLDQHAFKRVAGREFSFAHLLFSCELGLRRFLRTGPKIHLRDLVRRSGGLANTATHLDATFDASLVDLSLRRWALDLSPGWCGWLWRVVTIYYDFGEQDDG